MTTKRALVLAPVLLTLLGAAAVTLHADPNPASSVQTMILDEAGVFAPSSKLFIYSKDRQEFYEVRDTASTDELILPAGRYRIYAGLTQRASGIFEHYKSAEADVTVAPGESVSLIFALRKVIEHEVIVSDSVIEKIQLNPELSKNLN